TIRLPAAGVSEETVCALALMLKRPMMHRMNFAARMLAPPRAVFDWVCRVAQAHRLRYTAEAPPSGCRNSLFLGFPFCQPPAVLFQRVGRRREGGRRATSRCAKSARAFCSRRMGSP